MKKATYIVIKDTLRKHPEKMVFKHGSTSAVNCDRAHTYFKSLVEQGFYPVCYRKAGFFSRAKRTNWDEIEYGNKLIEKRNQWLSQLTSR